MHNLLSNLSTSQTSSMPVLVNTYKLLPFSIVISICYNSNMTITLSIITVKYYNISWFRFEGRCIVIYSSYSCEIIIYMNLTSF
nr:MAG TPA: hypothetical protein [Herelleviridae sp.]